MRFLIYVTELPWCPPPPAAVGADVVLADEPTGNLDTKTGDGILDVLAERHRLGLSMVMVTHDPAIAARADRVVKMVDGVVVEETAST